MPSSAHRTPLRSFVVIGVATFVLGGVVWMVTDLRAFDPISAGTVLGSAILWVMLGWMPSLAMGGLLIGTEILLGRHHGVRRRIGGVLTLASLGLIFAWCAGMDITVSVGDVHIEPGMYAKQIRQEGEAVEPGGVGSYVEGYKTPRSKYVALKTLETRRDDLRQGERWVPADLDAVEASARKSLESEHKWLRELSRETLIWSRLERMEPGGVAVLMAEDIVPDEDVVEWLVDWERPGRPPVETRMNAADHAAVQQWAVASLPDSLRALEWSMAQMGPGSVESVFSRPMDAPVVDVLLRGWCNTEGWSPFERGAVLSTGDQAALQAALDRLFAADDPMLRRQVEGYRTFLAPHLTAGKL